MTRLVFAENPMDPRDWEAVETEDTLAYLFDRYRGQWPPATRIFNLEGFDEVERAAGPVLGAVLGSRDVTPTDEASIDRLARLEGPLLVATAPGDPITAIIAVVAVLLGVAASLFLIPKAPDIGNETFKSPNNALSDRKNRPRPTERIPDIFGTVRSTPDLLAVPYRQFVNNLEVEVSYMCVGRGAYEISDVRDGDTLLGELAGAGASFYGPDTSPNSGVPQLEIGSPIDDPVLSVVVINEVNAQVLRPTNAGYVKGNASVRFTAPDLIETNDGSLDFTDHFEDGDEITVGGANFGSTQPTNIDVFAESARFYPDGKVEFDTFDPTTKWIAGNTVVLSNAAFAGQDGGGNVVYVDVSGTYVILSVAADHIMLDI